MKKRIPIIRSLVVPLLLAATIVPASAAHSDAENANRIRSVAAPPLSAFINIWLETSVDSLEPAIAYNSNHDEYLVVWSNTRSAGATKNIYARRVRSDGTLLSNFTIAHNANFHNYEPDVAYSPAQDEYLVVYTYDSVITDSDIWARRVKWNGADLDQPPYQEFPIGRPDKGGKQHKPAVAYNRDANEYLVVYQNSWGSLYDIDAVRVRASDGTSPGWRNIVSVANEFRSSPDVAYSEASNYYLIAYTFQPSSVTDSGDIYGKVTSWNMGYLSGEMHICDDANDQQAVALAASAGEYLAVWADGASSSTTEIYARRVGGDGTPLGPGGGFWIAGSPGRHEGAPCVAFGAGYGFLIAWQRMISGLNYNVHARYAMRGQDHTAGSEFALDNDVKVQMHPAVACAPSGECLMAEEDNNSVGGDFEIRGRLVMLHHVYLPLTLNNLP